MATVTVNGVTYTDDDNATTGLANGGHRTRLIPMFGNALIDVGAKKDAAAASAATATSQANLATSNGAAQVALATTQVSLATDQKNLATTQANNAAASAAAAVVSKDAAATSAAEAASSAAGFIGTSTTSLLIATGAKSFTTQSGEKYTVGIWVTATSAANVANYMYGQVTAYSGTTLAVDVQVIGGSGTLADWNISLAGTRGNIGATGPAGAGLTDQAVGFTATGGTTPKTLVVDDDITVTNVARRNAANSYTGAQKWATAAAIASAATVNLDAATTGNRAHITGTVAITAWTLTGGPFTVIFDAATPLTYHATTNRLNSGATSYTTTAGDTADIYSDGTTVFVNVTKVAGTAVVSSGLTAATQTEMEAAASNTVAVTPLSEKWHPGVAKAWLKASGDGLTINASHNIASITDTGTGVLDVTLTTAFSSANYVVLAMAKNGAGSPRWMYASAQLAGSFQLSAHNAANAADDPQSYLVACFGDQ